MPDKDPAPVPVQQDEPEAARCSCCDSELPWMDDGTKWGPCQKCALKDPAAPSRYSRTKRRRAMGTNQSLVREAMGL